MDRATLRDRIHRATERWPTVNHQEIEHLGHIVMSMPIEDRFDALAESFTDPPGNAFLAQEYAGRLLMKINPPCPQDLYVVLRSLLPKWNRSVEELPWYLGRVFGDDAVVRASLQPRSSTGPSQWRTGRSEGISSGGSPRRSHARFNVEWHGT
jgi:hypothetical protein